MGRAFEWEHIRSLVRSCEPSGSKCKSKQECGAMTRKDTTQRSWPHLTCTLWSSSCTTPGAQPCSSWRRHPEGAVEETSRARVHAVMSVGSHGDNADWLTRRPWRLCVSLRTTNGRVATSNHLDLANLQPEDNGPHKPKDECWVACVHVLASDVLQPHALALEPCQNRVDVLKTLQLHSRFLGRWNLNRV
jgi:hypothetical protein